MHKRPTIFLNNTTMTASDDEDFPAAPFASSNAPPTTSKEQQQSEDQNNDDMGSKVGSGIEVHEEGSNDHVAQNGEMEGLQSSKAPEQRGSNEVLKKQREGDQSGMLQGLNEGEQSGMMQGLQQSFDWRHVVIPGGFGSEVGSEAAPQANVGQLNQMTSYPPLPDLPPVDAGGKETNLPPNFPAGKYQQRQVMASASQYQRPPLASQYQDCFLASQNQDPSFGQIDQSNRMISEQQPLPPMQYRQEMSNQYQRPNPPVRYERSIRSNSNNMMRFRQGPPSSMGNNQFYSQTDEFNGWRQPNESHVFPYSNPASNGNYPQGISAFSNPPNRLQTPMQNSFAAQERHHSAVSYQQGQSYRSIPIPHQIPSSAFQTGDNDTPYSSSTTSFNFAGSQGTVGQKYTPPQMTAMEMSRTVNGLGNSATSRSSDANSFSQVSEISSNSVGKVKNQVDYEEVPNTLLPRTKSITTEHVVNNWIHICKIDPFIPRELPVDGEDRKNKVENGKQALTKFLNTCHQIIDEELQVALALLCRQNGITVAKGAKVSDMQDSAIDHAYTKTVDGRLNDAALRIIILACFLLYEPNAPHILTRIIPRIQEKFKIKIGRGDRSGNFVHALISFKRTTNVETTRARMMRKFKCALYMRKQDKYKVINGDAYNELPVKMTVDGIAIDWLLVSEADVHISLEDDNKAHWHNQLRQMKEESGSKQEFLDKVMMAANIEWSSGGDGQNVQGSLHQVKEERQDEIYDFDDADLDFCVDANSLGSINNDGLLAGSYMGGPSKSYSTHCAQSSQQAKGLQSQNSYQNKQPKTSSTQSSSSFSAQTMTDRRASEILASSLSQTRARNLLNDGGALTDQDISMMKQQLSISTREIRKLVTYFKERNNSKGTTAPKSHGTGATRQKVKESDGTGATRQNESDSPSDEESMTSKKKREYWKKYNKGKAAKSFKGGISSSEDEADEISRPSLTLPKNNTAGARKVTTKTAISTKPTVEAKTEHKAPPKKTATKGSRVRKMPPVKLKITGGGDSGLFAVPSLSFF